MKWQSYFKLAFRETRKERARLGFCLFSIAAGVTALTAVHSIIFNFEKSIAKETRKLMGADIALRSRHPFPKDEAQERLLADLLEKSQESLSQKESSSERNSFSKKKNFAKLIQLYSMLYQKGAKKGSALVSVLAVENNFPFYGQVETKPPGQWKRLGEASQPVLIVDPELLAKLKIKAGAELFLGRKAFRVIGSVVKEKSTLLNSFRMAPGVYVHRSYMKETALIQTGSRVFYQRLYRSSPAFDVKEWKKNNISRAKRNYIEIRTYEEAASGLQRFFRRLTGFLTIVSLVILLLGGIGVASTLSVFMKAREDHVAIFRNLGLKPSQVFRIYFILAMGLGLCGSLLGILPGSLLPLLASQFSAFQAIAKLLPFALEMEFSFLALLYGLFSGLGATLLFVLLPVYRLAHVPPLAVLRRDADWRQVSSPFARLLGFALIFACVFLLCVLLAAGALRSWENAFYFSSFLALALILLYLLSRFITYSIRYLLPYISSYHLRQGIANLYRPNNQTSMIITSLGAAFLLLALVFTIETSFQKELDMEAKEGRPNHFIIDVQPHQRYEILRILRESKVSSLQLAPMLIARIRSINGKSVYDEREIGENMELNTSQESWAERIRSREHYLAFRDHLLSSEQVVDGDFWEARTQKQELSVEERWAEHMKVGVGDRITFDVQGIDLQARISNLRRVRWQSMQPNAMLLLSPGFLEKAPRVYIGSYHIQGAKEALELQSLLLSSAPNVSIINVSDLLASLSQILEKISLFIRFLALLTLLNGIVILVGAVFASRFARLREAMLLKVLGAGRKDLYRILLSEYSALALLSSLCGLLLTGVSSYFLVDRFLKIFPIIPYAHLFALVLLLLLLNIALGFFLSRETMAASPLRILRE